MFLALLPVAPLATASNANLTIGFRLGNKGRLIVSYHVPPGVTELKLPENQAVLRRKQWRIVKGIATLGSSGIKLKTHNQPVQFTLAAKAVTKAPDRVYPLVIPFSNGGVVVNTSAFVPVNACQWTVLRFVPRQGEHAVLRGKVYSGPIKVKAFCSGPHDGGYAYMGTAAIEQHKAFLLVADPDAPSWIVHGTRAALQKALAHYRSRLSLSLPIRPTVYLSYSAGKPHARPWYHGDVLAFDTVRLSYVGKPWLQASSAASNLPNTRHFIAHEAFHFWNGDIKSEQVGPHDAWLIEGGAQLAALWTLTQAKWLDRTDLVHRLNRDLQRCVLETGDRPWAALKGRSIGGHSYYDCGATFNFMAAVLDNPAHPEQGFFKLWSQLLRVKSSTYSPAEFLRIAAQDAHDPAAAKDLEQALAGTTGSLSGLIGRLFTALKIPVRTVGNRTPADLSTAALLEPFVQPLLRSACKTRYHYGFWTRKGYIKVDVPARCKAFSRTKLLVAVGGVKLTGSPLAAWDKAYAECRQKGAVTFTVLHGDPLSLPCKKRVPSPPRLLQIEAYRAGTFAARKISAGHAPKAHG